MRLFLGSHLPYIFINLSREQAKSWWNLLYEHVSRIFGLDPWNHCRLNYPGPLRESLSKNRFWSITMKFLEIVQLLWDCEIILRSSWFLESFLERELESQKRQDIYIVPVLMQFTWFIQALTNPMGLPAPWEMQQKKEEGAWLVKGFASIKILFLVFFSNVVMSSFWWRVVLWWQKSVF